MITLLALSAVPYRVNAADGDLDLSFGTLGKVSTDFSGGMDLLGAVALQSDGKIVVAGTAQSVGRDFALARYNSNGTLDTSFSGYGKVTTDFSGGTDGGEAVALQSDGKIVVAGFGYQAGTDFDFALARYDSDGTLDTSFGSDGKVTTDFSGRRDEARAMALQSDGKIVVAGWSNQVGSGDDFALARYNSDGSLDDGTAADSTPADSFGSLGKVTTDFSAYNDLAYAVALQSDGKIVVAGYDGQPATDDFGLARYNSDGTLDTSFSGDGKVTADFSGASGRAWAVAMQSDGKIVVAGHVQSPGWDFALARYNSDGTLDNSLGGDGKVTTDFSGSTDLAQSVALQSDGKIVVAGYGYQAGTGYDFALARYNSDGTLDTSFSGDGKVTDDFSGGTDGAEAVALQSDGKIVVAGYAYQAGTDFDFALARYEGNSSAQGNINDVITGIKGSGLPAGTKTSLNAKLQAALAALQAGDTAAACSHLQDFLNYVNAQRNKMIPAPEADALTASVTAIRAELGCP
jgi:uncharacterized delta-60 repeat protein